MATLDTINTNVPVGTDLISNDEAQRQREIRDAAVATFGAEHNLAGAHNFPDGTLGATQLKNGQIFFDQNDENALLLVGGQTGTTAPLFEVGSVRSFSMVETRTWLSTPVSDAGRGNIYGLPKGVSSLVLGMTPPQLGIWRLFMEYRGGSSLIALTGGHYWNRRSSIALGAWRAEPGNYVIRAHCRYFNGLTNGITLSAIDSVLRIRNSLFAGNGNLVNGSYSGTTILTASGFTSAPLDVNLHKTAVVGSGPGDYTRKDLGSASFTITTTGDYMLAATLDSVQTLGITSLSLRIQRIS